MTYVNGEWDMYKISKEEYVELVYKLWDAGHLTFGSFRGMLDIAGFTDVEIHKEMIEFNQKLNFILKELH